MALKEVARNTHIHKVSTIFATIVFQQNCAMIAFALAYSNHCCQLLVIHLMPQKV